MTKFEELRSCHNAADVYSVERIVLMDEIPGINYAFCEYLEGKGINIADWDYGDLGSFVGWYILKMKESMNYYWIDTDYHYGDFDVKKWALIRGDFTEDGKKDRDSEEVVVWGEQPDTDDIEEAWRLVDEAIEAEIGFVPDYEVN